MKWLLLIPLCFAASEPLGESKFRVGTFDRVKVLPAFYRSEIWAKRMKSIKGEAEGASLQDRAHKQLTGEMPIGEVLLPLEKEWEAIAKEAGVSLIVEKPIYRDGTVELIDLSEKIAMKFPPAKKGEK